jgi:hypothetical protein
LPEYADVVRKVWCQQWSSGWRYSYFYNKFSSSGIY